jgi:hypothetical protein
MYNEDLEDIEWLEEDCSERRGEKITDGVFGWRWAFYACDELPCAFYFKDDFKRRPPVITSLVFVPLLSRHVTLRLVGFSYDGYERVKQHAGRIFPADLFNKPHKIDPQVSRSCPMEVYARWKEMTAALLAGKAWRR